MKNIAASSLALVLALSATALAEPDQADAIKPPRKRPRREGAPAKADAAPMPG